jgi:hypothetical protein
VQGAHRDHVTEAELCHRRPRPTGPGGLNAGSGDRDEQREPDPQQSGLEAVVEQKLPAEELVS